MIDLKTMISFLCLISIASADNLLQPFSDGNCGLSGGTALVNVQPNPANQFESSGCITGGQFQSVKYATIDQGFVCNLYSDSACQNFLQTIGAASGFVTCEAVIGAGVICFAQALFDNPFAFSQAQVTIGQTSILGSQGTFDGPQGMDIVVANAVAKACTDNGCDPNTPGTVNFDVATCTFLVGCDKSKTMSVSVSGNFDNASQRDYMRNILQTVFKQGTTVINDPNTFSNNGDSLVNVVSFAQVVIGGPQGTALEDTNLAEMSISISVSDNSSGGFDCEGILGTITESSLEAIPGVGGFAAPAFSIGCKGLTEGF